MNNGVICNLFTDHFSLYQHHTYVYWLGFADNTENVLNWSTTTFTNRKIRHSGFSCGTQEVLLTLQLSASPVLKYTGWQASRQYYRNGTLKMVKYTVIPKILCLMPYRPSYHNPHS